MSEMAEQARGPAMLVDVLLLISAHFQVEGNACLGLCRYTWRDKHLWRTLMEMEHTLRIPYGVDKMTATRVVIASRNDRLDVVQRLVDLGAKIEAKCNQGLTALNWASLGGNEQIARFMLDRHADIETRTKHGCTPLMSASQGGHVPMLKLLLDRGSKIEAKKNNHDTSLAMACFNLHVPAARYLLDKHANIETRGDDGYSPLLIASQQGHVPLIKLLLDRGAKIEAKTNEGFTALAEACQKGFVTAASLLLDRHADIEMGCNEGCSPLIMASQFNQVPVIALLCRRLADINAYDFNQNTALSTACFFARVEAVRALLALGANVDLGLIPPIIVTCLELNREENRKQQDMSTFWARRREVMIALVRARASNAVWRGRTALQYARANKQPGIIAVLENA